MPENVLTEAVRMRNFYWSGDVLNEPNSQSLSDKILVYGIGGIGLSCLITLIASGYQNILWLMSRMLS